MDSKWLLGRGGVPGGGVPGVCCRLGALETSENYLNQNNLTQHACVLCTQRKPRRAQG